MQPVDLGPQLRNLVGQRGTGRALPGPPVALGHQLALGVAQRFSRPELLIVDCSFLVAAHLRYLLVQISQVRQQAGPPLEGGQPRTERPVAHTRLTGPLAGSATADQPVRLAQLPGRRDLDHPAAHGIGVGAEARQDLRAARAAVTRHAEQYVLGADVVMAELQSLAQRELECSLGLRTERDMAAGPT